MLPPVAAVTQATGTICEQVVSALRAFGERALFSGETRLLASLMCGRRLERGNPAWPPPSLCVGPGWGSRGRGDSCLKLMECLPLCSSPLWTKLHPSGVLVPEEVLAPGMPGRLERELREGGVPGHGLQVSVGPRGLRKRLQGQDDRDRQRELKGSASHCPPASYPNKLLYSSRCPSNLLVTFMCCAVFSGQ